MEEKNLISDRLKKFKFYKTKTIKGSNHKLMGHN